MSLAIDPTSLRDLKRTISARWKNPSVSQAVKWLDKVATTEPMSTEICEFIYPTLPRTLQRWPDGTPIPVSQQGTFKITCTTERWGQSVPLSIQLLSDIAGSSLVADLGSVYGVSQSGLSNFFNTADEMRTECDVFPQYLVRDALQAGKTTLCQVDGVAFFSTAHPLIPSAAVGVNAATSVNQSNLFTSTALTATNAETVRKAMRAYRAENGRYWGISPNVLLVPPSLEIRAKEIYQSDRLALASMAGETNVGAIDNMAKNLVEVVVAPELENEPTVWYMLTTGRSIPGVVYGERQAPQIVCQDNPQSDSVFDYEQIKWKASLRAGVTLGHWAMIARCEA